MLEGFGCGYGLVQAVHDIDLSAQAGEITALLGPNGAGKTSTLMAIAGNVAVQRGSVRFDGEDVTRLSAAQRTRRGMALAPEGRRIFPDLSVAENLLVGGYLRSVAESRETEQRVLELFPRLRERYRQRAGSLSGGEQQMLAIGRALVSEPSLLLLDEPSLGLSPLLSQEVMQTVAELRTHGVTILLVEQNVYNALSVADRAYVLETGRIVACDTAAALLDNREVLRAYLGG
ncbi:MAG TPA: ABC transporter ATP-binding protein [Zeimonas sp.]